MKPWSGGKRFTEALDACIGQVFSQREVFNDVVTPVRPILSVYGRDGTGKAEAIADYCKSKDIPCNRIVVEPCKTVEIKRMIEEQCGLTGRLPGNVSYHVNLVVVIERADLLVFNPDEDDDGVTKIFSLSLKEVALKHGLMLVCMFNKTRRGQPMMATEYAKSFFEQMDDCMLFFSAPDANHRKYMFEYLFSSFAELVSALGRTNISLMLDDGHYEMLADYSAHCTERDIITFCQAMFYRILSPHPPIECRPLGMENEQDNTKYPIVVRMPFVESGLHTPNHMKMKCITRYDPSLPENEFSISCGLGPVNNTMTDAAAAAAAVAREKQREEMSEVQKEEEKRNREVWEAESLPAAPEGSLPGEGVSHLPAAPADGSQQPIKKVKVEE